MVKLRWSDFASRNEHSLVMRQKLLTDTPSVHHDHLDFCEICWVRSGSGWHLINGEKQPLVAGQILFIRPDDQHMLGSANAATGIEITNVAFPRSMAYPRPKKWKELAANWFWSDALFPVCVSLNTGSLHIIDHEAEMLALTPTNRWRAERFLLNIIAECEPSRQLAPHDSATPDWLRLAIEQMQNRKLLHEGTPALYRLCGRSAEHVSRTLQKHLQLSPTQFVNQLRLNEAARLLAMSELPILEVAAECGFENISYFYRLFQSRYQRSPKQHRNACLHPISGGA